MRILLIFIDGIGLTDDNPATNPFSVANIPTLNSLSNGKRWLRSTGKQISERAVFIPTDACLNVPGRPQSGTGQAVIVTGKNISQLIGRHYGPKPDIHTRKLLDEDNIFKQVVAQGKSATLLEAYPPNWHAKINRGKQLPSSYQYAARSAGLPFWGEDDLREGNALSGDWTGEGWHTHLGYDDIPIYTPFEAGTRMVTLAQRYTFSFFPHWATDIVGHRGTMADAIKLLEIFDAVMAGVLASWDDENGVIVITSDHGNMEEIGNRRHTENAVPTIVIGKQKTHFYDVTSLVDLVPCMTKVLFDIGRI